jgi:uncharacterized protein
MNTSRLLAQFKDLLSQRFTNRFKGIILYGSELSGESGEESDIDLLVVLEGPVNLGTDLEELISATYTIQKFLNRSLHFTIADFDDFNAGEFALYRNVKKDGIAA